MTSTHKEFWPNQAQEIMNRLDDLKIQIPGLTLAVLGIKNPFGLDKIVESWSKKNMVTFRNLRTLNTNLINEKLDKNIRLTLLFELVQIDKVILISARKMDDVNSPIKIKAIELQVPIENWTFKELKHITYLKRPGRSKPHNKKKDINTNG